MTEAKQVLGSGEDPFPPGRDDGSPAQDTSRLTAAAVADAVAAKERVSMWLDDTAGG